MTIARAIAAAVFFSICFTIGCNIGPDYPEVKAFMESPEYKRQEAAHFAKLARWEAAREKREAAR